MRIALVSESFFPAVDDTTTTLKAVADGLVDRGHTARIVAPGPGLTSYRASHVARIRTIEPVGPQVRAALDSFSPDLVHVTSPRTLGRKALKHTARRGIASVAVEQSPVLDLTAGYWRARIADRADRVLVTSSWMVERLASFGVDAELWAPGVDSAAFTPTLRDRWLHDSWSRARSADGPKVVVGYVGALHKRHGVRRLVELADLAGVRLVVVGDGPQREWLQARLPGAKLTGALPSSELTIAVPSLDVLVHPGEHETCCHALRAAAACAVPVVAPRSGGAPDVVRHLDTGLLYDPSDPAALRRAVAAVVADRHRGLLGTRGREVASARGWGEAVDDLVGIYDDVLGVGSTARAA